MSEKQHIHECERGSVPCGLSHGDPRAITDLRGRLPADGETVRLAELFRMFGDPTRVRILSALSESELCVCHLAELLGMTVSAVSHQLRLLKTARLVAGRREGKSIIYALADDHVRTMLQNGMEHIAE